MGKSKLAPALGGIIARSIILIFYLHSFLTGTSVALSIRSIGMGDAYPITALDPSGIYYNPAYLALWHASHKVNINKLGIHWELP